jgi:hypothetical protein
MPVLLAAMLTALLGLTGLAVDFGFATVERRALQNAADAAAVSGAINLVRGENPVAEVTTVANRNASVAGLVCEYVNAANAVTGPCTSAPSATTDGVRVQATNTRATFFLGVLGIPTFTVSAESTARVSAWTTNTPYEVGNSLFLVCGYNTRLWDRRPGEPEGLSILQGTPPGAPPWPVNPAAIGREFVIHDPDVARCGLQSSSFKGLNATSGEVTLPALLLSETGDRAGPTRTAVAGIAGCGAGLHTNDDALDGCIMPIPIFASVPDPNRDYVYAVRWLPFQIRRPLRGGKPDSNTHIGKLLDGYTIRQDTNTLLAPWTKNTKAAITSVRTVR